MLSALLGFFGSRASLGVAAVLLAMLATCAVDGRLKARKLNRVRAQLDDSTLVLHDTRRDLGQYIRSKQRADTVIAELRRANDDFADVARQDSLRLVAERNWWARRARQDSSDLATLRESLSNDSTLVCGDLFGSG